MASCQNCNTGFYGNRNTGFQNGRSRRAIPMPSPQNTTPSSEYRQEGCCHSHTDFLSGKALAMAYVPWQKWQNIMEPCKGFSRGTIFEDLDKPFHGKGGRRL